MYPTDEGLPTDELRETAEFDWRESESRKVCYPTPSLADAAKALWMDAWGRGCVHGVKISRKVIDST